MGMRKRELSRWKRNTHLPARIDGIPRWEDYMVKNKSQRESEDFLCKGLTEYMIILSVNV